MPYEQAGEQLFILLWMLPPLLGCVLIVFADLYYGVTLILMRADGAIYRDKHPFWYWAIELMQIAVVASMLARYLPGLWATARSLV